jgi:hypothetical protein
MRSTIVGLMAVGALVAGCRFKDPGDPGQSVRYGQFKAVFNPVHYVSDDDGTPDVPIASPEAMRTIAPPQRLSTTVHGGGTFDGAQANLLTVGFSASIDSLGCRAIAQKALAESRQLLIAGEGWITTWDYWATANTGSSPGDAGGPVSAQTQMCIEIYPPPPGCGDANDPLPPTQRLFSYSVASDKLVRCELGGPAVQVPVTPAGPTAPGVPRSQP